MENVVGALTDQELWALARIGARVPIYGPLNTVTPRTAATEWVHRLLAALDHPGYFEGDVSKNNLFRDVLVSEPYKVDAQGFVRPLEGPGLGLEVDEEFLVKHPVIEGPSYV